METPWDRAAKTKSEKQEETISRMPGGSKQINSGRSVWTSKRDNILGLVFKFLVEARTTDKKSYRVNKQEFLDLRKQAFQTPPGLLPMMVVDIDGLVIAVVELKDMNEIQTRMLDLEEKLHARDEEDGGASSLS
jgi:hypothetical protein